MAKGFKMIQDMVQDLKQLFYSVYSAIHTILC